MSNRVKSKSKLVFFDKNHYNRRMKELAGAAMAHVLACGEDVTARVFKTQISFYAQRMFAAVSDGPRKGTVRLSFVLTRPVEDSRIAARARPRADRYTHHVDLREASALDAQVDAWLCEAYCAVGLGLNTSNT